MPSQKNKSHGEIVAARTRRVLQAILREVKEQPDPIDRKVLDYRWQEAGVQQRLTIKTTLETLVQLTNQSGQQPELKVDDVREALREMRDFLGIMQDHRTQTQGNRQWEFTLTLSSDRLDRNLKEFDALWESKRSPKAKSQSQPEVTPRAGLKPGAPFQLERLPEKPSSEFQILIEDKTRDFVGREYVFEEIEDFISLHTKGYYIVEGDPGIGKSTILAEYVKRTGCIAYFNHQPNNTSSKKFLESTCGALIDRYQLPYSALPRDATGNGSFLSQLLTESKAKAPNNKLIISIDALDEVSDRTSKFDSTINILYLPKYLPNGVYFILTRRKFNHKLSVDTSVAKKVLDLTKYNNRNLEDTRKYIEREVTKIDEIGRIKRNGILSWISRQALTIPKFITQLNEKGEGNFLYIYFILNGVDEGFYVDKSIKTLPDNLNEYYNDLCTRVGMFSSDQDYTKAKIAYILSETYNPIPYEEIVSIIKYTGRKDAELVVDEVLNIWTQILRVQSLYDQCFYSPYHHSYRDFLHKVETVKRAGISIKEIKELMLNSMDLYTDG